MRLGLMLGYAAGKYELPLELVREADRLGVHAAVSYTHLDVYKRQTRKSHRST